PRPAPSAGCNRVSATLRSSPAPHRPNQRKGFLLPGSAGILPALVLERRRKSRLEACAPRNDRPLMPSGCRIGYAGFVTKNVVAVWRVKWRTSADDLGATLMDGNGVWLKGAKELLPGAVTLRRRIHEHPELGLHLPKTTQAVLDTLEGLDVKIDKG